MSRKLVFLLISWMVFAYLLSPILDAPTLKPDDAILAALAGHEYDISIGPIPIMR